MAMRIAKDDLWLCVDYTMAACNGDVTGVSVEDEESTDARIDEIWAGLEKLGPHLVPDFDSESGEGHDEFSNCWCDACGSRLAGEMHRFATLEPVPKLKIRELTEADVRRGDVKIDVRVEAETEVEVRNAFDSGDDAADRAAEDKILERLDRGEIEAWCCIVVTATYRQASASVSLGACSYECDFDARAVADEQGLIDDALEQLNARIKEAAEALAPLFEGVEAQAAE